MATLGRVLVMATIPVAKILTMCAIGTFLALPQLNIFTPDARKHMNKMVYLVFTPCLVFTRLVHAVTFEKLLDWWFIPFNVILSYGCGALIGVLVVKCCKPPEHLKGLTIACCAAGNTGNFPLVIVPGVCTEEGSPFGDSKTCVESAVAYVSFGMWMATVLMWTFIYNILRPPESHYNNILIPETINQYSGIMNGGPSQNDEDIHDRKVVNVPMINSNTFVASGSTSSANHNFNKMAMESAATSSPMRGLQIEYFASKCQVQCSKISKLLHLKEIFTPPTTAAFIALIIGGYAPLKAYFIGQQAPLRFFTECLSILGGAMIPCMNLILGGNLSEGVSNCSMSSYTISGILLARFLLLPVIGHIILLMVTSLHVVPMDPLFQFSLFLQFCMPTAINVGTVAQLHGTCEKETSVILFWSYTTSAFFLTIWIMVFLSHGQS